MQTNPGQLESIMLNNCRNKIIPCDIDQFYYVTSINLKRNYLEKLLEEIFNLVNIKYLDLQLNKLQTLPKAIFILTKLESISLNGNFYPDTPVRTPYERLNTLLNLGYIV